MVAFTATFLFSQKRLFVLEQSKVYRIYIVDAFIDKIFDYKVKDTAWRKRKTCFSQKIPGFIFIQLKGQSQGERCGFSGLIIFIAADLRKELSVHIRPFIDFRIGISLLIDQTE